MFTHRIFKHRHIYLSALLLLAVSLPLSMFGMSLASIILAANWLLEGGFREKWSRFIRTRGLWIFLMLYLVHVLWLIPSENLLYGLHDLKIKLPLFVLPLIIGTSEPLSKKELHYVLNAFIMAVVCATLISTAIYLRADPGQITNIRDISIFISHIRFGLMIVLSIFSLGMDIVMRNEPPGWLRIIRFMGMVWLMVFLLILKSVTGLVITIVLGLGLGVMVFVKTRHVALKYFVAALWLTATFLMVWTGLRFHVRYSYRVPIDFSTLETHTVNGRPYLHDTLNQQTENGYRTWLYMCEEELEASWTRRSTAEYSGRDANGNELRHTLIRYLTSRGLPKDSLGISRLSHEEIQWIEQGVANVIFTDGYSLYRLFYELAWQVDAYRQGGNPSGHSVTQRIEYMKAGWGIFLKNPIFGVGTGDVPDAFDRQYKAMHSMLSDEWRLRAHNQYLTFLISFGLVGFIVAIWAMFHPVFLQKGCTQFRFAVFLTIALLSMIPEDTLETSAGAMFISFFYAVLLFGTKSKIS